MRNSKQRDLILCIINQSCTHPTAEEIYAQCRTVMPNISLGTVYRNLNVLFEQNQIRKILGNDEVYRFDKKKKHAHFICDQCQKIIDLKSELVPEFTEIEHHQITNTELIFHGLCKDCRN